MRSIRLSMLSLFAVLAAGVQAQEADTKQLIADINNSDKLVRIQALDGLAELGASASAAVPALTAALADGDEEIVWHAARTLGAVGEGAATAVPKLTAALQARGYSDADLAKILGGNVLRVMEANQPAAP